MPTNREVNLAFQKILSKLDVIDAKVSAMPQVQVQVSDKFLVTLTALKKLGRPATATEIASITLRARACESKNLNELWGRGLLIKQRQGRKQLFSSRASNCTRYS